MFDMINIFEVFLPQLLRYPNPSDPLNGEAAALMMREPKHYETKVKGKSMKDVFGIHLVQVRLIRSGMGMQSTCSGMRQRLRRMKLEKTRTKKKSLKRRKKRKRVNPKAMRLQMTVRCYC